MGYKWSAIKPRLTLSHVDDAARYAFALGEHGQRTVGNMGRTRRGILIHNDSIASGEVMCPDLTGCQAEGAGAGLRAVGVPTIPRRRN